MKTTGFGPFFLIFCLSAVRTSWSGSQDIFDEETKTSYVPKETHLSARERRQIEYYDIYDEDQGNETSLKPRDLRTISTPSLTDVLFKKFWILVQEGLVITLLILAILYSIYVLIVPLTLGRSLNNSVMSLDWLMDKRVNELMKIVIKSIDPVDMTFGVMDIKQDSCRQKVVCELRRTIGLMSAVEGIVDNYIPYLPGMKKYENALKYGQDKRDCSAMFQSCPQNVNHKILKILKII